MENISEKKSVSEASSIEESLSSRSEANDPKIPEPI